MFNAIKINASRRDRTTVLGVLFFAVVMVLLPISSQAQCTKWYRSGVETSNVPHRRAS